MKKSGIGARARVTLIALVIASGTIVAGANPAAAGTCGQSFNPSVSGGKASWTLTCSGGKVTMSGWVEDTNADGKCARVKGVFNNNITYQTAGACPKGTRVSFSWTAPGTIANGYLTVT